MKPLRFYLPVYALCCLLLVASCVKEDFPDPAPPLQPVSSQPTELFDHAVERGLGPTADVPVRSKRIVKPSRPIHILPRLKKNREANDPHADSQ